jgi:RNA polymerase sigma-70 factor (ECF subfamily)
MALAGTRFPTTRWSRVLAAAGSSPSGRSALTELCGGYWMPLYVFVRRKTSDPERARDLTQAFFTRFLEKNDVAAADPARGRFRSWLLSCLTHFLANVHDAETAWKAGGRVKVVSIDEDEAEGHYGNVPADTPMDDALFDSLWAVTLTGRAMDAMRARCRDAGARDFLAAVTPLLPFPDTDAGETAALAEKLSLDAGAFKTRLSRQRTQFWGHVRAEIAETLEDPNGVDEELKHLITVLGAMWRM